MCLNKIEQTYTVTKPAKTEEVAGYKIFKKRNSGICGTVYSQRGANTINNANYPLREWVTATKGKIAVPNYDACGFRVGFKYYERGFHFFKTITDARKYDVDRGNIIVPIRARGIVAEGEQYGAKVFVAKQIRIEHGAIKKALKSKYK